jgi:uncharacterized protein (TIRG00374 family)
VTVRPRQVVWGIVAGGLAIALLRVSLRGIEWPRVWAIVAGCNVPRLALAAALMTSTLFLRACRWRVLLNAEGRVSVPNAFWATAAGYFGNNFLPARAGELVRTYFISSGSGLQYPYVLATAMAERVTDALVLVGIALAILLNGPVRPAWLADAARPIAVVAAIAGLSIAVLPFCGRQLEWILARMPLGDSWRARLVDMLHHGLRGLSAFHHPGRLGTFVLLTATIWCTDAVSTVIGASALGLTIPFSAAFLLLASLGLSSALPSTPGYVGIFQFVAVTVLVPFGLSRDDAIAYILVAQAVSYVVVAATGSMALARYRRRSSTSRLPTSLGS